MTDRLYGVMSGTVTDVNDPENLGRVKLNFPWMEGESTSYWARIATLMSGDKRGSWFIPVVGDEVLVAFDRGDVNHPYVLGFLWNGQSRPPVSDVQRRMIHSVNGHEIEVYDPDVQNGDKGYIRLKDAHGNEVELSNAAIRIRGVGTVSIEAPHVFINGRRVKLSAAPI